MSRSCILRLGDEPFLRRLRANPFRRDPEHPSPFLFVPKPMCVRPVQTTLQLFNDTGQQPRSRGQAEKVERSALKLSGTILLLTLLACGFGAQHIADTRKMNRLSRQLEQREAEFRALTQAYRTLQSIEAVRAAGESRQSEARQALTRPSPGKPSRGG